ncbi:MAG: Arm DNA-binding domain-containing protein [Thauera sp.]
MYLLIRPTGGKLWRLDYRYDGKRKTLAPAGYPDVALADARKARGSGARPIAEIMAPELLSTLRRIKVRGAIDSAHRAKQIAGQVFRYGIVTGRADRSSAAL